MLDPPPYDERFVAKLLWAWAPPAARGELVKLILALQGQAAATGAYARLLYEVFAKLERAERGGV